MLTSEPILCLRSGGPGVGRLRSDPFVYESSALVVDPPIRSVR